MIVEGADAGDTGEKVKPKVPDVPFAEVLEVGREQMARVEWVCDKVIEWGECVGENIRGWGMQERAQRCVDRVRAQQGGIRREFQSFIARNPSDDLPTLFLSFYIFGQEGSHDGIKAARRTGDSQAKISITFKQEQSQYLEELLKFIQIFGKGSTTVLNSKYGWKDIGGSKIEKVLKGRNCKAVIIKDRGRGTTSVYIYPVELEVSKAYVYAVGRSVLEGSEESEEKKDE